MERVLARNKRAYWSARANYLNLIRITPVNKIKLLTLNFFCAFIILYIAILAWAQLTVTTPNCDNDFKTFSLSLVEHHHPYKINRYVRVIHVEKKDHKTTMQTSPPITAVNMNTPLMSLLLQQMLHISGKMNLDISFYVFLSLFCAGMSVAFLMQLFTISPRFFLPLLLLLWLSWPSLYNLKLGQISFLLLPLLSFSFLLLHRQAYCLMAIVLGLLASLKLFFLIFILFFVMKRQWRLSLLFLLSFAVFFFLPLIYFHWSDFHAFFMMASKRQLFLDRSTLPMNGSLLGFVMNTADLLHIIPSQNQVTLSVSILCSYAIVRWLVYDYYFLQTLPEYEDALRFSFLILIALFCSPLAWIYYFLFLIIPLVTIIQISQRYVLSAWFYVFLIDALLLLYFPYTGKEVGILGFLLRFSVFMSLVCWLFALNIAAKAISNGVRVTNALQQPKKMIGIFSCYALLSVTLLSFNYGMPYLLDPDKTPYLKSVAPVLWLPIKSA